MSSSVSWNPGFSIGKTLSGAKHELRACPFSVHSLKEFMNYYDAISIRSLVSNDNNNDIEENKNNNNNNDAGSSGRSSGSYSFKYALVSNSQEMNNALDVSSKLKASYGALSGDAEVNFAMENTQSSMSVSLVICAQQTGRVIKNARYDTQLKLSEVVKDFITKIITDTEVDESDQKDAEIENVQKMKMKKKKKEKKKKSAVEIFTEKFGQYLIIGVEYGGKAVLTTHFQTASRSDKKQMEAKLRVKYGGLFSSVSSETGVKSENSSMQTSVNSSYDYRIFPSAKSEKTSNVVRGLELLSHPEIRDDDNKENSQITLSVELQELLSSNTLDPINAIYIPLLTIKCVSDAFIDVPEIEQKCWKPFNVAMNNVYQALQRSWKDFKIVSRKWPIDKRTGNVVGAMRAWGFNLPIKIEQMRKCNLTDVLPLYEAFVDNPSQNEMPEYLKPFYLMNALQLEVQFRSEILNAYNIYLNNKGGNNNKNNNNKNEEVANNADEG